ncbi:conserved exported hypothetical protein [Gammaproteobacteria bacterium]
MKKICRLLTAVVVCASAVGALADDITDQIERGLKAYGAQGYTKAIQELQFALAQIQEKLNTGYLALMPDPLPGWRADPPEAQTAAVLMGGGTQVSRHYHNENGQEITLEITIDSPLVQTLNLMLSNDSVFASDPTIKSYRFDTYHGVLRKEGATREISLLVGKRVTVKATCQDIKDEKHLESYLKAMDLKKIITIVDG